LPRSVLPRHQRCSGPTGSTSASRCLWRLRVRRTEGSGVQCAAAARAEEGHGGGDALTASTAAPQRRTNDRRAEGLRHRRLCSGKAWVSARARRPCVVLLGRTDARAVATKSGSGSGQSKRSDAAPYRQAPSGSPSAYGTALRRSARSAIRPGWLRKFSVCSELYFG
jgi:hypothetical protein